MSKAEKFISDCTRNCSNLMQVPTLDDRGNIVPKTHPWLTPDQARRAVVIEREEIYEWLRVNLCNYFDAPRSVFEMCLDDLKQAMKMSKTEDLSREYVLPFLNKACEKYGEHKQMELSRFDGYDMMSAYEEGYHQAEKDLELTWKDLKTLDDISDTVYAECDVEMFDEEEYYQEILKRYKERKGKKEL